MLLDIVRWSLPFPFLSFPYLEVSVSCQGQGLSVVSRALLVVVVLVLVQRARGLPCLVALVLAPKLVHRSLRSVSLTRQP